MKKLLAILLLCAAPALAQGGAPAQSGISHFSVTASAIPWAGSGQAAPGTIEGGSITLTQRFAMGFQRVDLSPITYNLADVEYTIPLTSLVGKKISAKFTFNPVPWSVTFFGGGGLSSQFIQTPTYSYTDQEPAFTIGMGINYTANGHVAIQVVSGQWIRTSTPGAAINEFLVSPNSASISSGLKITF